MPIDYQLIAENIQDGFYLLDRKRRITYWNPAAERITGYAAEEVLGKSCADNILVHVDAQGRNLCQGMCPIAATMDDEESRQAEVFLKHKKGHRVPVNVRTAPLRGKDDRVVGGMEIFTASRNQDMMAERLRKLERLALVDELTGLPNRRYLNTELGSRLNMYHRENLPFGLLFLDIDHFKTFNDQYGHQAGDSVLINLSKTVTGIIRSFDTFGRWGGEEFLGIFPNTDRGELEISGKRLLAVIRHIQVPRPQGNLKITVTIGGAGVRKDDTTETIIRRADRRLYRGKAAGRDRLIISPKLI